MSDTRHMDHALALARRGLGNTWPNPAVGCVLVRDGRVVGRGWTQPGGRPHAERMALDQAGPLAAGATAYVTLEPCAHHGRTPPCCDAIIAAGIGRVISALEDPDPRVAGRGHGLLRAAMRFKWLTIAVTLAIFATSVWGMRFVEQQFFPTSDRTEVLVDITERQNASIARTRADMDRLEASLADDDDVAGFDLLAENPSDSVVLRFVDDGWPGEGEVGLVDSRSLDDAAAFSDIAEQHR